MAHATGIFNKIYQRQFPGFRRGSRRGGRTAAGRRAKKNAAGVHITNRQSGRGLKKPYLPLCCAPEAPRRQFLSKKICAGAKANPEQAGPALHII